MAKLKNVVTFKRSGKTYLKFMTAYLTSKGQTFYTGYSKRQLVTRWHKGLPVVGAGTYLIQAGEMWFAF